MAISVCKCFFFLCVLCCCLLPRCEVCRPTFHYSEEALAPVGGILNHAVHQRVEEKHSTARAEHVCIVRSRWVCGELQLWYHSPLTSVREGLLFFPHCLLCCLVYSYFVYWLRCSVFSVHFLVWFGLAFWLFLLTLVLRFLLFYSV